jgi:DNA-binding transcriptional LysR family regulator
MELRHLRYFVALAEELHFGRAAERLHIAQPGLSQQIGQLERELGVKLFYRSSRQVQLTSAGALFLGEARRTLKQADRAAEVARRASRGEIGELRIGYIEQAAHGILSELLPEFHVRNANVSLTLDLFVTTPAITEALVRDAIDVGFGLGPVHHEGLEYRLIKQEELLVALRAVHPLANLPEIPMERLAGEPWNLWRRELNPPLHEAIMDFFREAGFSPDVRYEGVETEEVYLWVVAGAVSLVPESTAMATEPKGVVVRRLIDPTPSWNHVVIWRKSDKDPVLARFIELERKLQEAGTFSEGTSGS